MRPLSILARAAAFASETKEVFLFLLTLDHATLPEPIRVVNDYAYVVSGGFTYVAFPFEIVLPAQRDDQIPVGQIKVDNSDRRIVRAVRSVEGPMKATLQIILASQPDTVEWLYEGFQLKSVSYDAQTVEGELRLEEILIEPYPQHLFNPGNFPGLFANA